MEPWVIEGLCYPWPKHRSEATKTEHLCSFGDCDLVEASTLTVFSFGVPCVAFPGLEFRVSDGGAGVKAVKPF